MHRWPVALLILCTLCAFSGCGKETGITPTDANSVLIYPVKFKYQQPANVDEPGREATEIRVNSLYGDFVCATPTDAAWDANAKTLVCTKGEPFRVLRGASVNSGAMDLAIRGTWRTAGMWYDGVALPPNGQLIAK